jgi:hypothetical protein
MFETLQNIVKERGADISEWLIEGTNKGGVSQRKS